MAFDEILFPLRARYGSAGGPRFRTRIVALENGAERRNQTWSQCRRAYDAKSGVVTGEDAAALVAFFQARRGRLRGFRLHDWADGTSASDGCSDPSMTDQVIGTGDGATVSFQLVKLYGVGEIFFTRKIKKPVAGSVSVALSGVSVSAWSVDSTTGIVTFAAPPPVGVSVTAGYRFDVPVRFDTDFLSVEADGVSIASADVPMVEIVAP